MSTGIAGGFAGQAFTSLLRPSGDLRFKPPPSYFVMKTSSMRMCIFVINTWVLIQYQDTVLPLWTSNVLHDDVIKWKHFPRHWPFVRWIHRSPVNSPHKGQWRGALMFSLIWARINSCVPNHEAGGLRRHRAQYDVTVMIFTAMGLATFRRHHLYNDLGVVTYKSLSILTFAKKTYRMLVLTNLPLKGVGVILHVYFKTHFMCWYLDTSREFVHRCEIPQSIHWWYSKLVQVIFWCHQAPNHYMRQCWSRSMTPYGGTKPQ